MLKEVATTIIVALFLIGLSPSASQATSYTIRIVSSIPYNIGSYYFDQSDGLVYGIGSGVFVINAATNTVTKEMLPSIQINQVFFNRADHELYIQYCPTIGCSTYFNLAIIKGKLVKTILKVSYNKILPTILAFDGANKGLYLLGSDEDPYGVSGLCPCYFEATVVNTSTDKISTTLMLGGPFDDSGGDMGQYIAAAMFDPSNAKLYFSTCFWTNEPSLDGSINTISSHNVVRQVLPFGCNSFAYDQGNKDLYLKAPCGQYCYDALIVGSADNAILKYIPRCLNCFDSTYSPQAQTSYDPSNNEMFLTTVPLACNTLACPDKVSAYGTSGQVKFSLNAPIVSTGSGPFPLLPQTFFDPGNREMYVVTFFSDTTNISSVDSQNQISQTTTLPVNFDGALYNPANRDEYISWNYYNSTTQTSSYGVYVLGPNNNVLRDLHLNNIPYGCSASFYDPASQTVYCIENGYPGYTFLISSS